MSDGRDAIRVVPRSSVRPCGGAAHRRLLPDAPSTVLGAERVPPIAVAGVAPSRNTCFGPRGVALGGRSGPLFVADTGHHRLLGFESLPRYDQAPADFVIGQPDFEHEGRNAKGPISPTSLNVPAGVCVLGARGIAVADAWNHRVLLWLTTPRADNVPPDVVLGQPDFTRGDPNRNGATAADTLCWPYGVACIDGRLFVADSQNRRVLVWERLPTRHGQPADRVLGQASFDERDENAGREPDARSMRWPHAICGWQGRLCVADAGNNRVLVWGAVPEQSFAAADFILGQARPDAVDHNQSRYFPRADTLNMPYSLTSAGDWLIVADTGSSRLLGYHASDLRTGAAARALGGQAGFEDKGDNRWSLATADSFCWPHGVSACDGVLAVADCGNDRVSVWELAP